MRISLDKRGQSIIAFAIFSLWGIGLGRAMAAAPETDEVAPGLAEIEIGSAGSPEQAGHEAAPGDEVTCDLSDQVLAQDNYYDGLRLVSDCLSLEIPNKRRAHYLGLRGDIYLKIKMFDAAYSDFDEAINLGATNLKLYLGRGYSHLGQEMTTEALVDFRKAMSLAPKSPDGPTAIGHAHYQNGVFDEAMIFLDHALSIDPKHTPALLLRAQVLFDTGAFVRSVETASKVLQSEPENYNALYTRGRAYFHLSEFEKAFSDLEAATTLRPYDDEMLTDKALALVGLRRLRDAVSALDLATELRPGNSRAFFIRGKLKLAQDKTEKGHEDIRQAIAIDPEGYFVEEAFELLSAGRVKASPDTASD